MCHTNAYCTAIDENSFCWTFQTWNTNDPPVAEYCLSGAITLSNNGVPYGTLLIEAWMHQGEPILIEIQLISSDVTFPQIKADEIGTELAEGFLSSFPGVDYGHHPAVEQFTEASIITSIIEIARRVTPETDPIELAQLLKPVDEALKTQFV